MSPKALNIFILTGTVWYITFVREPSIQRMLISCSIKIPIKGSPSIVTFNYLAVKFGQISNLKFSLVQGNLVSFLCALFFLLDPHILPKSYHTWTLTKSPETKTRITITCFSVHYTAAASVLLPLDLTSWKGSSKCKTMLFSFPMNENILRYLHWLKFTHSSLIGLFLINTALIFLSAFPNVPTRSMEKYFSAQRQDISLIFNALILDENVSRFILQFDDCKSAVNFQPQLQFNK